MSISNDMRKSALLSDVFISDSFVYKVSKRTVKSEVKFAFLYKTLDICVTHGVK